jgi:hypothetical protein
MPKNISRKTTPDGIVYIRRNPQDGSVYATTLDFSKYVMEPPLETVRVPVPPDKLIMDYVREEAERCAKLCEAIPDDIEFLVHCIRYSVQPSEIEDRRSRFNEFKGLSHTQAEALMMQPDPDLEDLM